MWEENKKFPRLEKKKLNYFFHCFWPLCVHFACICSTWNFAQQLYLIFWSRFKEFFNNFLWKTKEKFVTKNKLISCLCEILFQYGDANQRKKIIIWSMKCNFLERAQRGRATHMPEWNKRILWIVNKEKCFLFWFSLKQISWLVSQCVFFSLIETLFQLCGSIPFSYISIKKEEIDPWTRIDEQPAKSCVKLKTWNVKQQLSYLCHIILHISFGFFL